MEFRYEGNSLKSGVYYITNITDGKVYIGSAKEFKRRGKQHLSALEKGRHGNPELQHAFDKDGTDSFVFSVAELVDGDRVARTTAEQHHLDLYLDRWGQCYNHAKNAVREDGPWSSTPEETRIRLSESHKGHKHSAETRRKIAEGNKLRVVTQESRKRMSESHKGRIFSAETRAKMSESRKGIIFSEETKKRMSDAHKGHIPWNKGIKIR